MPLIHLKNRFIEYKFDIENKYTLIQGDSANGKTTLYDIISEYASHPGNIQCPGYAKLRAVPELVSLHEYEMILTGVSKNVFVMDENSTLLRLRGYEQVLQNSDNYYIILYRLRNFGNLPVSLDSVCRIKTSGRFHTLVPLYATEQKGIPECVITEDSQSGNKFMKEVLVLEHLVEHAGKAFGKDTGGKDALSKAIKEKYLNGDRNIGIVFDRSGIGTAYDAICELKARYPDLQLFEVDWERCRNNAERYCFSQFRLSV